MPDDDNLRTLARRYVAMWRLSEQATHGTVGALLDRETREVARTASAAGAVAMLNAVAGAIHGLASGADCERVLRMMAEEVGR